MLRRFWDDRRGELDSSGKRPGVKGPQSPIEAQLLEALQKVPGLPTPELQYEIRNGDRLVTVPDFAYPGARIAVFCDGFAFHGNPDTLELDAKKRNWLQSREGGASLGRPDLLGPNDHEERRSLRKTRSRIFTASRLNG